MAPQTARELAAGMDVDAALLYRLLRAEASIGLLVEDYSGGFTLTDSGDLLRAAHPRSLAAMARLEEGPQHYALWKHLPAMIRDGKQNAFMREFGHMAFDHAKADHDYAGRFDQAMTSYSAAQAVQVLEALQAAHNPFLRPAKTIQETPVISLIRREAVEQPRTTGALKPVLAAVARGV